MRELLPQPPCVSVPSSAADSRIEADVVCAGCSQLFGWREVELDTGSFAFRCGACVTAARARDRIFSLRRALREPFFYIALTVLLAGVAYVAGVGNPSVADTARLDSGRPWYQRRSGKLWFRQALRARSRVAALEQRGLNREAKAWAGLAQGAFLKAAESWANGEVLPDLRLAAARMHAKAAGPAAAHEALHALADTVPPGHASRPAYLYQRALLAAEAGRQEQANADWLELLRELAPLSSSKGMDSIVDKLVEFAAKDKAVMFRVVGIQTACGAKIPPDAMRETALTELRKHGVPVPVELGTPATPARVANPPPADKRPPKKKLVIKRFNQ